MPIFCMCPCLSCCCLCVCMPILLLFVCVHAYLAIVCTCACLSCYCLYVCRRRKNNINFMLFPSMLFNYTENRSSLLEKNILTLAFEL